MSQRRDRKRLLVVDDEPLVLRSLARALRAEYELTTATSGAEALEALAAGASFDAVLSDISMPGMDGIEFATRAAIARPELTNRIVFMTGGSLHGALARLQASGAAVLPKPIDMAALRAALANVAGGGS